MSHMYSIAWACVIVTRNNYFYLSKNLIDCRPGRRQREEYIKVSVKTQTSCRWHKRRHEVLLSNDIYTCMRILHFQSIFVGLRNQCRCFKIVTWCSKCLPKQLWQIIYFGSNNIPYVSGKYIDHSYLDMVICH